MNGRPTTDDTAGLEPCMVEWLQSQNTSKSAAIDNNIIMNPLSSEEAAKSKQPTLEDARAFLKSAMEEESIDYTYQKGRTSSLTASCSSHDDLSVASHYLNDVFVRSSSHDSTAPSHEHRAHNEAAASKKNKPQADMISFSALKSLSTSQLPESSYPYDVTCEYDTYTLRRPADLSKYATTNASNKGNASMRSAVHQIDFMETFSAPRKGNKDKIDVTGQFYNNFYG